MEDSTASAQKSAVSPSEAAAHAAEQQSHTLGEFASTAICGNDITSSCLYVSALAIGAAGQLAPITLALVAGLLFLFRRIYAEVVGALPLNGGAYNALLNTTSKARATVAACLTILSYMATAVISAGEAMHYLSYVWDGLLPSFPLPVIPATILLIGVFTVLTIAGISESSRVAIAIFVTHLGTLTLLALVAICYVLFFSDKGMQTFKDNWNSDLAISEEINEGGHFENSAATESAEDDGTSSPRTGDAPSEVTATANTSHRTQPWWKNLLYGKSHNDHGKRYRQKRIGLGSALFFGFAVALLGISGFESSSNFVEEQAQGVFPKTLRNMWIAVTVFNPLMALLALALVPIAETQQHYQTFLLAEMGKRAAGGGSMGTLFAAVISINAFMVLSGAVLTSFVGVNGLVRRMTLDRCLPQALLKTNSRGTTHRILIMFFVMCVSVLLITQGDIGALAGVYTISFLTVMTLFAVGNVLLKIKRANLPRPTTAPWASVCLAIVGVVLGLVGNAVRNPDYLIVFLYYFVPTMLVVAVMLYRIPLLKACLTIVRAVASSLIGPLNNTARFVRAKIAEINSQQVVFFTRGDNVANLNNAMIYVMENEDTNRIKVVTVVDESQEAPPKLKDDLRFLDEAYPQIDVEFVVLKGKFGPELIQQLSHEWHVPTNLMFIGSPGGRLPYGLEELGGVRLII